MKNTFSKTEARLDALWREALLARNGQVCRKCRALRDVSQPSFDCAHIVGRTHRSTRWLLRNGVVLCRACHFYFGNHPLEFTGWVVATFGEAFHDNLVFLGNQTFTGSPEVYESVERQLARDGGLSHA